MARGRRLLWLALLAIGLTGGAQAQELRLALKAAVDSNDPHQSYTPNRNVQFHVYQPLLWQDEHTKAVPLLAESWRAVDPNTWSFKLRDDAVFADGSPFTAEDVMFSIRRAQAATGIRTYRLYVRDVVSMEAAGSKTVLLHTNTPWALLPGNLAAFSMVSAKAAVDAVDADFNGGRASLGTGPYRWVRFTPGQDVVLERNAAYWGPKPAWEKVIFRFVPNDSARTAGLLAGDLDVIDTVPPSLQAKVRESDRTRLATATSSFTLYFSMDQRREVSPYVTGPDGQPLPKNPLKDVRVRRAMSLALTRTGIAEQAMEGGAEPASQFMPPGFDGYNPDLKVPVLDRAGARRLLREAGYPDGFGLTVHCTNDRFAGDARVCQTVAQLLTNIGIKTSVEALPAAVFFRRAGNAISPSEFSVAMAIYANLAGLGSETLNAVVRTPDARGLGATNRGGYSSPRLDAMLAEVGVMFDAPQRDKLLREATALAMDDLGVIPLFHIKASWGLRRNLTLTPRGDQNTFATDVRPAP